MKFVIDMNLSPSWVEAFIQSGHQAIHWSTIGSPRAKDREIMKWARENGHIVFTHDLDFGAILAATNARAPSVIQLRAQDPSPLRCQNMLLLVIKKYEADLIRGALVTADENRARLTILPLGQE